MLVELDGVVVVAGVFHIHIDIGMGQQLHGLGGSQQVRILLERIPQLVGRVGVEQVADGVTVRLAGPGNFPHQCLDQRFNEVCHLHLALIAGVIQVHHLTVDIHVHGDGGLDKR